MDPTDESAPSEQVAGCPSESALLAILEKGIDEAPEALVAHIEGCPSCRELLSVLSHGRHALTETGRQLGRYELRGGLGQGAMGTVHRAFDPRLGREVAVKVLSDRARENVGRKGEERLLREARSLAKIRHPHVVPVHDTGVDEGAVWLAMELVDGVTLMEWIDRESPSWREALQLVIGVGRGLDAVHRAGLIHRDFKPANVMVTQRDGHTHGVLMDFGLVGAVVASAELGALDVNAPITETTHAGRFVGTPAFMAPEQLRGESATALSDQFAFATVVWMAVYGQRPFAGETVRTLSASILSGQGPQATGKRGVPGWVRSVCERALSVDPSARFRSVAALLAALESGPARQRRRSWIRGTAVFCLGAAGVAAALFGVAAQYERACVLESQRLAEMTRTAVKEIPVAMDGPASSEVATQRVREGLTVYEQAWRTEVFDACMARRERDADYVVRQTWCFEHQKLQFEALLDQARASGADAALWIVEAVQSLPESGRCNDATVVESTLVAPSGAADLEPLRRDLWAARLARIAGRDVQPHETAALIRRAREVGWAPLVARAELLAARAFYTAEASLDARAALTRAYVAATEARDWGTATHAALDLARFHLDQRDDVETANEWVSIAQASEALGPDDPVFSARRTRLQGILARASADYVGSERLLRDAQQQFVEQFDEGHPEVAQTLRELASTLFEDERFAESEQALRDALLTFEATLGPSHPRVGDTWAALGAMLSATSNLEGALHALRQAERVISSTRGPSHPSLGVVLNALGGVHVGRGDLEDARRVLRRFLEINAASVGREHSSMAMGLTNLALVAYRSGDFAEAERLAREGTHIARIALGPEHPDTLDSETMLAGALGKLGKGDEALGLVAHVAAQTRTQFGDHGKTVDALSNHAATLLQFGHAAEAAERYREAATMAEAVLEPGDPQYASLVESLAEASAATDRR